jgi:hypothetical protein
MNTRLWCPTRECTKIKILPCIRFIGLGTKVLISKVFDDHLFEKVFDDHLWASSHSWSPYMFEKRYQAMAAAKPDAMKYLQETHKKLWTRSQYKTLSKVDYVTNNLAESFNNWIKPKKGKHLDDLLDTIR